MSEAELQSAVLELAALLGWLCFHARPARTRDGWRTAVEGNGAAGWPDVFMVKPGSSLAPYAVELKSDKGRVSVAQQAWLDCLCEAGCFTAVWRPEDWMSGRIERALRA